MAVMNRNSSVAYTDYKYLSKIPMTIITDLATDKSDIAENFWKILYYADTKPLTQAKLTTKQKTNLIWNPDKISMNGDGTVNYGTGQSNVHLQPLNSDSVSPTNEQIQFRLFRYGTDPDDRMQSTLIYQFMVLTSDKSSLIQDEDRLWVERTDKMEEYLLSLLNGRAIKNADGVGFASSPIEFNMKKSRALKSMQNVNNGKSLYGRTFFMAVDYAISSKGGVCGG